jgi:hypothetical protein
LNSRTRAPGKRSAVVTADSDAADAFRVGIATGAFNLDASRSAADGIAARPGRRAASTADGNSRTARRGVRLRIEALVPGRKLACRRRIARAPCSYLCSSLRHIEETAELTLCRTLCCCAALTDLAPLPGKSLTALCWPLPGESLSTLPLPLAS